MSFIFFEILCIIFYALKNITLRRRPHASPDFREVHGTHMHMHKLKSSWQTEGTPALISLPGLRKTEILRVLCSLGKLVREETGANDRPSWHDMLCSPRAIVDSVRAFVTFSTEGRSQWKMKGSPPLNSLNNNKDNYCIMCVIELGTERFTL